MSSEKKDEKLEKRPANMLGAGLVIGAGVGVALGVAMDNIGIGIALGIGIGLAIGAGLSQAQKVDSTDDEKPG